MQSASPSLFRSALFGVCLFVTTLANAAPSGEAKFNDCYARWDAAGLTVGNSRFERSWEVRPSGLEATGFKTKSPDKNWFAPDTAARTEKAAAVTLSATAETGRLSTVDAESLRLMVRLSGATEANYILQLFPNTPGLTITQSSPDTSASTAPSEKTAASSGIELASTPPKAPPEHLGLTGLRLAPEHLRVIQIELVDQTDDHDELVFERDWLLSVKEKPFGTSGNLLVLEDNLTRDGLVFLTLAPLPHARPVKRARDFDVDPRRRTVRPVADNYPVATLAYTGGTAGRVAVLQQFQRQLRIYDPQRDGRFMSNTWGDRSRDARINEAFILQEIEAGARLGVDVVQIDDGWQKGRTSNSARGSGVWNGYWAADPEFWMPDPVRFPRGLGPVVAAARERGMSFGLWFGPDSSNDAANWHRDAQRIIQLHRESGIGYIKIDSIKAPTPGAALNQRRFFDTILEATQGKVVVDLDVTAEIRPGYFGVPHTGPLFVENRYTDFRSYWPHHTLRNLWRLAHYVDPVRLRMEFLNPERNAAKYGDDPLAPARYQADTLFAMTMVANPLGWFETSNLSPAFIAQVAPLVKTWKSERARFHGGRTIPVGSAPDGREWTGFVSHAEGGGGYVLLFRELNPSETFVVPLQGIGRAAAKATVIGGRGTATVIDGKLEAKVPKPLDFVWVRIEG